MTTFHELTCENSRSLSFGLEGLTRPRAATVSFRYEVPESPIYRPSVSPPTSPPSLILPPRRMKSGSLGRTFSRVSLTDERLASSAPSASQFWPFESESSQFRLGDEFPSRNMLQFKSSADFILVEEDVDDYCYYPSDKYLRDSCPGKDSTTFKQSPSADPELAQIDSTTHSFSASPVLMSCLRDIAKTRRAE